MGKFYLLSSSEKEPCVQTDSEFSLFRASNELLNVNAEGVVDDEDEKQVDGDLAAQAALEAEKENVQNFARIIMIKSQAKKIQKIFPIVKQKNKDGSI